MAVTARRSAYHPPSRGAPKPGARAGPFRLVSKPRKPAPKIENEIHKRGNRTIIFQKVNGKVQRVVIREPGKTPTPMGPRQYIELQKRVAAYRKKHPRSTAAQVAVGLAASHVEMFKSLAKEGTHSVLASLVDLM